MVSEPQDLCSDCLTAAARGPGELGWFLLVSNRPCKVARLTVFTLLEAAVLSPSRLHGGHSADFRELRAALKSRPHINTNALIFIKTSSVPRSLSEIIQIMIY